eukprot:c20601_g1_i1.p1 GENE.c20601_g1_i1~~c20601_g1_i1.p1  ORF type:complete len:221 (-),score=47.50 c20601_g1_i1:1042-1704(-)
MRTAISVLQATSLSQLSSGGAVLQELLPTLRAADWARAIHQVAPVGAAGGVCNAVLSAMTIAAVQGHVTINHCSEFLEQFHHAGTAPNLVSYALLADCSYLLGDKHRLDAAIAHATDHSRKACSKEPIRAPRASAQAKSQIQVLDEDDHIIVVHKPHGMNVHPLAGKAGGDKHTAVDGLVAYCGANLSRLAQRFSNSIGAIIIKATNFGPRALQQKIGFP